MEDLLLAYMEMAKDTKRERDALEWSNSLIGDGVLAAQQEDRLSPTRLYLTA